MPGTMFAGQNATCSISAKHLAGALNQLADHLIPAQDDVDNVREPLFAVLDALREKLGAVEKLIDAVKVPQ
jgi:hypothetical protein